MTSTGASTGHLSATFLARADRFGAVVDAGPAPGRNWQSPSPCADWTAADVLDHVIDAERHFLNERDPGERGPNERGADVGQRPTGDPPEAWHAHLDAVRRLLADGTLAAVAYDGHFGRTSVGDSLVRFYGFDLLVHGWDLAQALGRNFTLTDAEVAALDAEADSFGPALHTDGICGVAWEPPADADPQQRLLARLGRRA